MERIKRISRAPRGSFESFQAELRCWSTGNSQVALVDFIANALSAQLELFGRTTGSVRTARATPQTTNGTGLPVVPLSGPSLLAPPASPEPPLRDEEPPFLRTSSRCRPGAARARESERSRWRMLGLRRPDFATVRSLRRRRLRDPLLLAGTSAPGTYGTTTGRARTRTDAVDRRFGQRTRPSAAQRLPLSRLGRSQANSTTPSSPTETRPSSTTCLPMTCPSPLRSPRVGPPLRVTSNCRAASAFARRWCVRTVLLMLRMLN